MQVIEMATGNKKNYGVNRMHALITAKPAVKASRALAGRDSTCSHLQPLRRSSSERGSVRVATFFIRNPYGAPLRRDRTGLWPEHAPVATAS